MHRAVAEAGPVAVTTVGLVSTSLGADESNGTDKSSAHTMYHQNSWCSSAHRREWRGLDSQTR